MSFMDIFKPAPVPTAQPTTPPVTPPPSQNQTPGAPLPGTTASPVTAANGVIPIVPPGNSGDPGTSGSPLDTYKDIWNTPTNPATPQPLFANLDPAKITAAAQRVDFSKVITPETLAKIQAGGAGATEALIVAMNQVAQASYAQSTVATTKLIEQAIARTNQDNQAALPGLVRQLSVNEGLREQNALLSHPAVQPMVGALSSQFAQKNPNATPAEIQWQVSDYVLQLSKAFAPPITPVVEKVNPTEDWAKFFDVAPIS